MRIWNQYNAFEIYERVPVSRHCIGACAFKRRAPIYGIASINRKEAPNVFHSTISDTLRENLTRLNEDAFKCCGQNPLKQQNYQSCYNFINIYYTISMSLAQNVFFDRQTDRYRDRQTKKADK